MGALLAVVLLVSLPGFNISCENMWGRYDVTIVAAHVCVKPVNFIK